MYMPRLIQTASVDLHSMNICSKHFGAAHSAIVNFLHQTILLLNNIELYCPRNNATLFIQFSLYVLDLELEGLLCNGFLYIGGFFI